jgi:hypothetical protein
MFKMFSKKELFSKFTWHFDKIKRQFHFEKSLFWENNGSSVIWKCPYYSLSRTRRRKPTTAEARKIPHRESLITATIHTCFRHLLGGEEGGPICLLCRRMSWNGFRVTRKRDERHSQLNVNFAQNKTRWASLTAKRDERHSQLKVMNVTQNNVINFTHNKTWWTSLKTKRDERHSQQNAMSVTHN